MTHPITSLQMLYAPKHVLSANIRHIASQLSPTDYPLVRLCDSINGIVTLCLVITVKFCSQILSDNFSRRIGYDYPKIEPRLTNGFNHSSVTLVLRFSLSVFWYTLMYCLMHCLLLPKPSWKLPSHNLLITFWLILQAFQLTIGLINPLESLHCNNPFFCLSKFDSKSLFVIPILIAQPHWHLDQYYLFIDFVSHTSLLYCRWHLQSTSYFA